MCKEHRKKQRRVLNGSQRETVRVKRNERRELSVGSSWHERGARDVSLGVRSMSWLSPPPSPFLAGLLHTLRLVCAHAHSAQPALLFVPALIFRARSLAPPTFFHPTAIIIKRHGSSFLYICRCSATAFHARAALYCIKY